MDKSLMGMMAAGVAGGLLLAATPARAGVYRALCAGGSECTVTLANGQISLPGQVIPKEQVLSWSQGGSGSKSDVGLGVVTTVFFGLPGLLGFAAKQHDYQYNINHLDDLGNNQLVTVSFRNDVPANQFMMELMGMTGLSVGQVNQTLQARIDMIKAQAAEKARIEALDCARVLKPYACSWSAYQTANPAVQVWAKRYPQFVQAEKAKLRAAD
jgi:hypothetical protein